MAAYLEEALKEGEPSLVVQALGAIAKARGMAQIAQRYRFAAKTFLPIINSV